jgi:hypothetical protein
MTVQRRVTDISNNLNNQTREKAEEFKYYSLAMNESTDWTDTANLIFIRGTEQNLAISEELAALCSIKDHTTGNETAHEVIKSVIEKVGLTIDNALSFCNDGTPFMEENCWSCDSCGIKDICW